MTARSITVTVPASRYADHDDCLSAAAADLVSDRPALAGYDLGARWADEEREEIELAIPIHVATVDELTTVATKRAVRGWEPVATYVATYPTDDGEGACDVTVEIGQSDGVWYVRTSDDAGGSDEGPDAPFASEEEARAAAERLAEEMDEGVGESAPAYLRRREDEAIEDGTAEDGTVRIVSSQDGSAWSAPRFSRRDAAELWVARWHEDVQRANPGTVILWHLMDCPEITTGARSTARQDDR